MQAVIPFTIKSGGALSPALNIEAFLYAAIQLPASFEGTALSFQGGIHANDTFVNLKDGSGGELSVPCGASLGIGLGTIAADLAPWPFIKVRSGTSATPVNQSADRACAIVVKS